MADTQGSGEGQEALGVQTRVDLDAMSDQEIMALITTAIERLAPMRLSEVIEAVQARRKVKEEEVKSALLSEFRERALQLGLSLETLLGGAQNAYPNSLVYKLQWGDAPCDLFSPGCRAFRSRLMI